MLFPSVQVDVHARAERTFVSIDLDGVDVRTALRRLGREHLFGVSIAPDVRGTVNLHLRNVLFETALSNIVRQADAKFSLDHGFYAVVPGRETTIVEPMWAFGIGPMPTEEQQAWWVERSSNAELYETLIPFVEFEKTDLRVALSWLFQKVGVAYRFDPRAKGTITASLRNATFEECLQKICWQVGTSYWRKDGVFVIAPKRFLPRQDLRSSTIRP